MRRIVPFVVVLAIASPAAGQSVDDESAGRIAGDLSRYIGTGAFDNGLVRISVDGDAYRVFLDLEAIGGGEAGASLDLAPLALRVKPLADGTFAVSGEFPLAGSFGFRLPETEQSPAVNSHFEWILQEGRLAGIFDPELAAFATASGSFGGLKAISRDDNQEVEITIGAGTIDVTGKRSAGSGIDYSSTQTMTDFVETLAVPTSPDAPPLPVTIAAPRITVASTATGFQSRPLLDLLAFGVAQSGRDKGEIDQRELKRLLLAALPMWDTISAGYHLGDLAIDTPVGRFGLDSFETTIGIDGIRTDGALGYQFGFSGITIPADLVPDWGQPLLPTHVSLNFGVHNLDTESPVRQIIEALDLGREPPIPDEVRATVLASFLDNPPVFVLERSVIRNADVEIVMSAEMPFSIEEPELSATVEVAGFDTAAAAVTAAAAADPDMEQVLPFFLAARGIARVLDDGRLQWLVKSRSDGAVLVNGAMLKGPDPVE
ncbi:MAG: hypothetical protein ACK4U0_07670 [Mesorhizobium sp.]